MLQTDMHVMLVYPEDQPLPADSEAGALTLILYYAPAFGDFYKSDLFQSLRRIMQPDCLVILVSNEGQSK